MKRFFRKLILRLFVLVLIILGVFWFLGYREYQKVTRHASISEKLETLKTSKSYLTYEQLPVLFLDATVSVEDERFYQREGVLDKEALLRAAWTNLKNFKFLEGGSTIPQQVSKNLYFGHETTPIQKIAEYYITKDLLEIQSKNQVLEIYVNIIYYGNGAYGVSEAAYNYFGLNPWDLNEGELTILAGLPQAPSVYDLTQNFHLAKNRQAHVLSRMVKGKIITQDEANQYYNMEVLGYEEND